MEAPNALTLNDKLDFIIDQLRAIRRELQSLDIVSEDDEPDCLVPYSKSEQARIDSGHGKGDF